MPLKPKANRPDTPQLYPEGDASVTGDRFSEETSAYAVRGVDTANIDQGIAVLKEQVKTLPARPGVYRMINATGDVLYVGKAKSLAARVVQYTQINRMPRRLQRMVAQTRSLVIVTTQTEAEALLLEANMIKRFRPPYNVLLRDDKSFPYIYLREDHDFAQINKHRGTKKGGGVFYGPFASASAVNRTLNTLQKVFLLRSCTDSFFHNRSRPCLLYQIKRCSAPCTERISKDDYKNLVSDAKAFLSGRSQDIQKQLSTKMQMAAEQLDFEAAARMRDRLRSLTYIQQEQSLNADGTGDADIIAIAEKSGITCIQIFFIRGGQNWGNRAVFPRHDKSETIEDVLTAFIGQFYEDKPAPKRILLDRSLPEQNLLAEALSTRCDFRVSVETPQRGQLVQVVATASRNAVEALDRKLAESASQARHLEAIADVFDLPRVPERIEVYDNSHIQGTNAIGAMIVAGPDGFIKNAYRKYNIRSTEFTPGDDFGMMKEVLTRRLGRLADVNPPTTETDEDASGHETMPAASETYPDLLLIDGGRGQLNVVLAVMRDLGIEDISVIGVAKGPDRNAGRETFYLPNGKELTLEPNTPALFFLQRLRDEAHRFAIGTHRQKRAKAMEANPLDDVPGIGPSRKKALLMHFGSARSVKQAGLADLRKVEGISAAMAKAIHDHFHPAT